MVKYNIEFDKKIPKKGQKTYVLIGRIREKVDGDPIEFNKTPAIRIFKSDRWSYSVGQMEGGEFEKVGGDIPSSVKPWEESTRLWNKLKPKLKEVGVTDSEKVLEKVSASLEREHFEIEPKEESKKSEDSFDGFPHPGGGITDNIIYEPVGAGKYAYKTIDGEKGIAEPGTETIKEEGVETTLHYLDFGDEQWFFEEDIEPLVNPLFNPVSEEVVKEWVEGEREPPGVKGLWEMALIYYKSFLDLPREAEYSFMVLEVFQSWIAELLPIVFYLGIQGEFGGGKTVSGEAVILPCHHGFQTGNTSPSFVARGVESQKLTIFSDELDSTRGTEDNTLYQIFRQGYRRGLKYTRSDKDHPDRLQSFEVFSAKLFTAHATVETALRTRTIPLHSRETDDIKYPIVNVDKLSFGEKLKEDFFLWWMDNAFDLKNEEFEAMLPIGLDQLDQLDLVIGRAPSLRESSRVGNISKDPPLTYNWSSQSSMSSEISEIADKLRKKLYERKKTILEEDQIEKLKGVSGRNVELMYQVFALSNLLDVDIDEDVAKVFEQKRMEEAEEREVGMVGILRDLLVEKYDNKKSDLDFRTEDGRVKIANKEVYGKFNDRLKDEGLNGVSPHTFKEYLTELGFSDVTNRKKLEVKLPDESEAQSRMCDIFDDRVLRKLGVEDDLVLGSQEKEILHCLKDDAGHSAEEIADKLSMSEETVEKTLKALYNAEYVEKTGEKIGGGMIYKLIEEDKSSRDNRNERDTGKVEDLGTLEEDEEVEIPCEVCEEEMGIKREAERKVNMNGRERWLCEKCLQEMGYE